jgi:hypothetical protein
MVMRIKANKAREYARMPLSTDEEETGTHKRKNNIWLNLKIALK